MLKTTILFPLLAAGLSAQNATPVGTPNASMVRFDVKAIDKTMVIGEIRLEYKSGGRSGTYRRRHR